MPFLRANQARCARSFSCGELTHHHPLIAAIFSAYMKRAEPNSVLTEFERHTALGPTGAARLLGLPYVSYAQYRSGLRALKQQHLNHIRAVTLLDRKVLVKLVEELSDAKE